MWPHPNPSVAKRAYIFPVMNDHVSRMVAARSLHHFLTCGVPRVKDKALGLHNGLLCATIRHVPCTAPCLADGFAWCVALASPSAKATVNHTLELQNGTVALLAYYADDYGRCGFLLMWCFFFGQLSKMFLVDWGALKTRPRCPGEEALLQFASKTFHKTYC